MSSAHAPVKGAMLLVLEYPYPVEGSSYDFVPGSSVVEIQNVNLPTGFINVYFCWWLRRRKLVDLINSDKAFACAAGIRRW